MVSGDQAEAAAARLAEVQSKLQAAVDELLGGAVPPDQPLMEAGLDSIGDHLTALPSPCICPRRTLSRACHTVATAGMEASLYHTAVSPYPGVVMRIIVFFLRCLNK